MLLKKRLYSNIYMYIFYTQLLARISVNRCPELTEAVNGTYNTTITIFGSVVEYSCTLGYSTLEGSVSQTVTCLDTGNWSAEFSHCYGMYNHFVQLRPEIYKSEHCLNSLNFLFPEVTLHVVSTYVGTGDTSI